MDQWRTILGGVRVVDQSGRILDGTGIVRNVLLMKEPE